MLDSIGLYRIVRQIGRGGMGHIHEARDERLQRAVAIKTILPSTDPVMRDRFLREARSAAAVSHLHICQLFEIALARSQRPRWTASHVAAVRRKRNPGQGGAGDSRSRLRGSGRARAARATPSMTAENPSAPAVQSPAIGRVRPVFRGGTNLGDYSFST